MFYDDDDDQQAEQYTITLPICFSIFRVGNQTADKYMLTQGSPYVDLSNFTN